MQYDAVKRYVGLPHVSPCTPNTLGHHTQDLTGACTHSVDRNSTALRGVKSPFTPSRPDRCLRDAIESLVRAGAAEPHAARFAAAHGVLAAAHHTPTLHLRRAREARARLPAAALCRRGDRPPPDSRSPPATLSGGEPDREERDPRPAIGTGDGVSRAAVAACCCFEMLPRQVAHARVALRAELRIRRQLRHQHPPEVVGPLAAAPLAVVAAPAIDLARLLWRPVLVHHEAEVRARLVRALVGVVVVLTWPMTAMIMSSAFLIRR